MGPHPDQCKFVRPFEEGFGDDSNNPLLITIGWDFDFDVLLFYSYGIYIYTRRFV